MVLGIRLRSVGRSSAGYGMAFPRVSPIRSWGIAHTILGYRLHGPGISPIRTEGIAYTAHGYRRYGPRVSPIRPTSIAYTARGHEVPPPGTRTIDRGEEESTQHCPRRPENQIRGSQWDGPRTWDGTVRVGLGEIATPNVALRRPAPDLQDAPEKGGRHLCQPEASSTSTDRNERSTTI